MTRTGVGRVFSAVIWMAVGTGASKLLGMAREVFVAQAFGAGPNTDAFLVATTIPLSILPSITAAIGSTFIPLFIERHDRDSSLGWRFASRTINLFSLWALILLALGFLFTDRIVEFMSPGLTSDTALLAAKLTRILLASLVPQAISIPLVGSLQALGKFVWPALLGVPQNMIIIVAILVWGPSHGIEAIAFGTVAGYLLGAGLLWITLTKSGFRHSWVAGLVDDGVVQLLRMAVPLVLATLLGQVSLLTDRGFASYLPQGSISALNWATLIYTLPVSIVGLSLLTVLYPKLVRSLSDGIHVFERYFLSGTHGLVYIMVPISIGTIWFRTEIVQVLFERGAFDQAATQATARALLFFAPSVVFHVLDQWLRKAFFSMHDSISPTVFGSISTILNIGLSFLLLRTLQHGGLALAYSLSLATANITMLLRLRVRLPHIDFIGLAGALLKSTGAALGAVLPARWLFEHSFGGVPRGGVGVEGVRVALFLALFLCLYGPVAWLFGGRALRALIRGGTTA